MSSLYLFIIRYIHSIEEKSQAGFLYADDVCLMASNEQHLQTIFVISGYIKEYGMKINGKKSKVVCINGAKKDWSWNLVGVKLVRLKNISI